MKDFQSRVRFDVNVSSQTGEAIEYGATNNQHVKSDNFSQFLGHFVQRLDNENLKLLLIRCQ